MSELNSLSDRTKLPKLDYEGRARSVALEEEDRETLAWYCAGLEVRVGKLRDAAQHMAAFLAGHGDVAEIAAERLRRALRETE